MGNDRCNCSIAFASRCAGLHASLLSFATFGPLGEELFGVRALRRIEPIDGRHDRELRALLEISLIDEPSQRFARLLDAQPDEVVEQPPARDTLEGVGGAGVL